MTAKNDILEGLHVLLVTEDESRAQALARALRDRKASVGDAKAGARDPVALRGVDLIIVDARTADATRSRLAEMRADVRARWASIATLDFAELVLDDGAIHLAPLEKAVAPLTESDRALTERARKEGKFETTLAPLGPSRTLRALSKAGATLHLTLEQGELRSTICLSNELLVCAFVERGNERYEAWSALARVLGLSDASISVEKRAHPTAMNIMEPINQALEVAAQERKSAANLPAVMPQASKVAVGGSAADELSDLPAVKPAANNAKKTWLGVAGGAPPLRPPLRPEPKAVPLAPPRVEPPRRPAAPERPPVGRTLLGIAAPPPPLHDAEAARAPAPANDVVPPPRRKSRPELSPVPLDDNAPRARAIPDEKGLAFPSMAANAASDRKPLTQEHPVNRAPLTSQQAPDDDLNALVRGQRQTAEIKSSDEIVRAAFGDEATAQGPNLARMTLGDMPTDPTALKGKPEVMVELPDLPKPPPTPSLPESSDGPREVEPPSQTKSAGSETFQENDTRPFDSSSLMAAIQEEVPESPVAEGAAELINPVIRKQIQEETLVMVRREQRRSRAVMLFVLFLFAAGQLYALNYIRERERELDERIAQAAGMYKFPDAPAASRKAPAQAPAATAEAADTTDSEAAPSAEAPKADTTKVDAPKPSAEPTTTTPEAAATKAADAQAAPQAEGETAKLPKGSADDLLKQGLKLLADGKAAEAKLYLLQAVAGDSKNAHAHAGLAEAYLALGETRQAMNSIETAIKLRPKRARYRVQQGDIFKAQGDPEAAREAYQKALELDPNDREATRRLAAP